MLRPAICAVLAFCLLSNPLHAQISPGELSRTHAHLEGLGHCTSCHALGKAVSNDKCLACHVQVQTRMAAERGLHALYAERRCVECHKEHHGRDFPVIKLDVSSFNHAIVGFTLQGAHTRLMCTQCHKREFVRVEDVLENSAALEQGTYLGLSSECASCHADVHRGQLTAACARCHGMDGWKPASKYDHTMAKFHLTGLHVKVECNKCHMKDPAGVVRFAGLQFSSCQACHKDPHAGRFKERCESCHTTNGWRQVAAGHFDHATTRFPLLGRHASVKCAKCHGERKGVPAAARELTEFSRCSDCHADAHAGQLRDRTDRGACESCHTVKGFAPSTFSVEQHQRTRFALSGGHLAVPCRSCHASEQVAGTRSWKFHWQGPERCESCHKDPHRRQFAAAVPSGCPACHSTEGWRNVRFSHERTHFPLQGKHMDLACARCHLITGTVSQGRGVPAIDTARTHPDAPARLLRWKGIVECATCHPDVHQGQFAQRTGNRCEACHSTLAWNVLVFSHEKTRFPLTGGHVQVPCAKCHRKADPGTPRERQIYIGTPTGCADCHASGKDKQRTASGGDR